MPEVGKPKTPVINAMLTPKAEYVKLADWQGKSLTFILAEEVLVKQKPGLLGRRKIKTEKMEDEPPAGSFSLSALPFPQTPPFPSRRQEFLPIF